MRKERKQNRKGLTLIELMISAVIAIIVIFGIGIVLSDSHRGFNSMYDRVYSDVVTNGHVARRMFDSTVRKSSSQGFLLDENGQWVEIYYYSDPNIATVNRYARFFVAGDTLNIERGQLNPKQTLSVEPICADVNACTFKGAGRSLQMLLTLSNGSETITTLTSAVMHN
jgi:Tfp pilus assembly protein PilW